MKSFYVMNMDFNSKKIHKYNVIPYLVDQYNSRSKKERPKTFEEFKEFVNHWSAYQWWGRCQYEILVSDWPRQDTTHKIDVHYQVMLNIDTVAQILMDEISKK